MVRRITNEILGVKELRQSTGALQIMGTTSETKITTYIFRFSILVTVDMVFQDRVFAGNLYLVLHNTLVKHQACTRGVILTGSAPISHAKYQKETYIENNNWLPK